MPNDKSHLWCVTTERRLKAQLDLDNRHHNEYVFIFFRQDRQTKGARQKFYSYVRTNGTSRDHCGVVCLYPVFFSLLYVLKSRLFDLSIVIIISI